MKHCQGQKVKDQGHEVTRRCSTKTSNISRERHPVVEIHVLQEIVVAETDGEGSL